MLAHQYDSLAVLVLQVPTILQRRRPGFLEKMLKILAIVLDDPSK